MAYVGIAVAAVAASWSAWTIAGDVVSVRISKAEEQLSALLAQPGFGAREFVYKDTLRMARERPVFGWGMGSFPAVFPLYNTQVSGDHIPVVYHDAHSDWIQSLAEIGAAGTLLIALAVAFPARALLKRRLTPLPQFLIVGCGLVGLYAWIEFPFGNVAVVLMWWICFFCAVQYARLTPSENVAGAER